MSQVENNALAGGERQEAIDHCLAGISRLSNEVTDVASSIPAYDQRTYSQVRETSVLQPFGILSDFSYRPSKHSQRI